MIQTVGIIFLLSGSSCYFQVNHNGIWLLENNSWPTKSLWHSNDLQMEELAHFSSVVTDDLNKLNHRQVASVRCWLCAGSWGAFVCQSRQGLLALGGDLLYAPFVNVTSMSAHTEQRFVWSATSLLICWPELCLIKSVNQWQIVNKRIHMLHTYEITVSGSGNNVSLLCFFPTDSLGQPKSLWETSPQVKWDHYHPKMFLWPMKMDRVLE